MTFYLVTFLQQGTDVLIARCGVEASTPELAVQRAAERLDIRWLAAKLKVRNVEFKVGTLPPSRSEVGEAISAAVNGSRRFDL